MSVWNFMSREQQMQVRKLQEQQGINPISKQPNAETRKAALETQLTVHYQPDKDDKIRKVGETPTEIAWGRNRGNHALPARHQVASARSPADS